MARVVNDKEVGSSKAIKLLNDEQGGLLYEEGIATITFYKGDAASAAKALREQLTRVVAANPWVSGRLVRKGMVDNNLCLVHQVTPSPSDIDPIFASSSAYKPSSKTAYPTLLTGMYASKAVIVGSGTSLVDQPNKPVTLLTITESTEPNEFAVVFSMTHAIADGRTYYEILKMLQPGAPVEPLSADRIQSFSEDMRDQCGRKELEWADKPSAQCMYTCAMMFAKPVKVFGFHLDQERVAAAKAKAIEGTNLPYVTTNDVITSAFFNETQARIGMMGMDCRNKIQGVVGNCAGNYVTALTLDPGTFGTPALLREMLNTTPHVTTKMPLPSCCGWMAGKESAKFAMATNWASFAGNLIQLPDAEMVIHLPVHNPAYCAYDLMVPFMSTPGKVGVICWTISTDEAGLREAMPVGESVSNDLFPQV